MVDRDKDQAEEQAEEVVELVEQIRPLLAGRSPEVQSAVLADLLALWLAGHQALDAAGATAIDKVRAQLLQNHMELVLSLIPINEKEILACVEPLWRQDKEGQR
jgi:MoxR-like ATPase